MSTCADGPARAIHQGGDYHGRRGETSQFQGGGHRRRIIRAAPSFHACSATSLEVPLTISLSLLFRLVVQYYAKEEFPAEADRVRSCRAHPCSFGGSCRTHTCSFGGLATATAEQRSVAQSAQRPGALLYLSLARARSASALHPLPFDNTGGARAKAVPEDEARARALRRCRRPLVSASAPCIFCC